MKRFFNRHIQNKILKWISHPKWSIALICLGLLLTLPSITSGLGADDMTQQQILSETTIHDNTPNPWMDLFKFVPDDQRIEAKMRLNGQLPWWAHPELKISFFRPVTVGTHIVDNILWPKTYWIHHLHNMLWYILSILSVFWLYRQLTPSVATAGLAALLFTIEDAHAFPVGWLANRNTLLAVVFVSITIVLPGAAFAAVIAAPSAGFVPSTSAEVKVRVFALAVVTVEGVSPYEYPVISALPFETIKTELPLRR